MACVKISAICPIQVLERVSDQLRWQHVNKDFKLPWKQDVIPILAEGSPTYQTVSQPETLTKEEGDLLVLAHERLSKLCQECESEGICLLVDAEYSSIQPAIDYIINVAACKFNKGDHPLVYSTLQTYLKDSFQRLNLAVKGSHERGLSYGVKIVRGAYILREKALAASLQAPSPIHSNIEETHRCYNSCAAFMLEQVSSGNASVVVATHNMASGMKPIFSFKTRKHTLIYISYMGLQNLSLHAWYFCGNTDCFQ
jgi:proline dehydrogenase